MNRFHYLLTCALMLFLTASCAPLQHNTSGIQPLSIVNTDPGMLSPQYRSILDRAMKDADYHCRYPKLAESELAQYIIDPGLFQVAYQTTHSFKASDHLYTTGQAQGLLREREHKIQRIAQLQKMRGRGNQVMIQELNREVASINQLLGSAHLNKALIEHQNLERKWIDSAISRVAQLKNLDITYQALAEFDVGLETYGRMCADWRPSYYGNKQHFPITTEKADIAHLRKAVEDKMYTILMSGNSAIASQINAINTFRDESHFFNTYNRGSAASVNALKRAGLYEIFKRQSEQAREHDRKLKNSINPTHEINRERTSAVASIGPTEAEMKEAFLQDMENAGGTRSGSDSIAINNEITGSSSHITHFKKIECVKAPEQPGYHCKYEVSIAMNFISREATLAGERHAEAATRLLKIFAPEKTIQTRRFVRSGSGWQVFQK